MECPFSAASERNKLPILQVLAQYELRGTVLEIGHGTGQHGEFFVQFLDVQWQPTDVEENIWMMRERRALLGEDHVQRLLTPLPLRAQEGRTLESQLSQRFDHGFSANTLHIMSEAEAQIFCQEVGALIKPRGHLFLYGPFCFQGEFTSESNRDFDQSLRSRGGDMGIRDFEMIEQNLKNFRFVKRYDLPANNNLLVFVREE